jgi:hypothetical protein
MKKLAENGGNVEWLKGRKYLINPELLGPVRTVVGQSRKVIMKFALPFPINSIYLVPKESLKEIDDGLQHLKERFQEKVLEFEAQYALALEEARENLKELFNETDYPADIRSKFNFEWRYLALSVPDKALILSPEIYQREKDKFVSLMEETREIAMTALREEFSEVLTFLVDRLKEDNGKPKVIKDGLFIKLQEFLGDFENRNLFQDDTLAQLTEQAKALIGGVSAYNLKFNHGIREKVRNEMEFLKQTIDGAIMDMPMRRLRLDLKEAA